MVGLDRQEVVTIFRRHFANLTITDSMINSIAMAIAETVEENNKRILKELKIVDNRNTHRAGGGL